MLRRAIGGRSKSLLQTVGRLTIYQRYDSEQQWLLSGEVKIYDGEQVISDVTYDFDVVTDDSPDANRPEEGGGIPDVPGKVRASGLLIEELIGTENIILQLEDGRRTSCKSS